LHIGVLGSRFLYNDDRLRLDKWGMLRKKTRLEQVRRLTAHMGSQLVKRI